MSTARFRPEYIEPAQDGFCHENRLNILKLETDNLPGMYVAPLNVYHRKGEFIFSVSQEVTFSSVSLTPNQKGYSFGMISGFSDVSDLPAAILEEYRSLGWADEEILENLSDAIEFLNIFVWHDKWAGDISLSAIFSPGANLRG